MPVFRPGWRYVTRPRFVGTVDPGPVAVSFHDGTTMAAAIVRVDFGGIPIGPPSGPPPHGPPGPKRVTVDFVG